MSEKQISLSNGLNNLEYDLKNYILPTESKCLTCDGNMISLKSLDEHIFIQNFENNLWSLQEFSVQLEINNER